MWWKVDAALHAKMQVFLCKTQHCTSMLREHVVNHGYWGSVWFMGHTSSDPTGEVVVDFMVCWCL